MRSVDPTAPHPAVLHPAVLRAGDRVALVAPSGPSAPERIARGVQLLRSWGLDVEPPVPGGSGHGYLDGSDEQRLAQLNRALRDPAIRAVLCTRGGYGAQRIVDGVDVRAVRDDPKLFLGFSDVTALHLALWRGARLATVHGPGLAWDDRRTPRASADSVRHALFSTDPVRLAPDPAIPTYALRTGGAGTVSGRLLGGNLTLLAASAGTRDAPALHGALLLVEDVGEAPYRVDRLLTQLLRAGTLAGVAGVLVGDFAGCAAATGPDVVAVLGERLGRLGVPVVGGYPLGHGPGQLAVPLGTPATVAPDTGVLTVAAAGRPRESGM